MRHLLRLDDWAADDLDEVFRLAARYEQGDGPRIEGCAVLFFPPSSLRTRVSFERGAALMGLQPVTFPPATLDKPEALADVAQYLAAWADVLVVRHADLGVLEGLAAADALPVVNAMTDVNHPCEVLSDLYTLSRPDAGFGARPDAASGAGLVGLRGLRFLFVGADGNIARAWQEAARVVGLDLVQCCPADLATPGARWTDDLRAAIRVADVVLTDGPGQHRDALAPFQITAELLALAPDGVRLAPCPPFLRGREVSADAIASAAFVGHGFKASLLHVQQAVLALCVGV